MKRDNRKCVSPAVRAGGSTPRYDAVIFDMDGTLIEPLLDFAAIRAELGIASRDGIIEALEAMPPARRRRASAQLERWELAAARRASLREGAAQMLLAVQQAGLKTALLTRNARRAMQTVLSRFELTFDLAWSREDGPIKPEPDGILRACRRLGVRPERTACVGDFRYDIVAANAAGAVSVLLAPKDGCEFADQADFVINRLAELPPLLGI
ncbi:MAG: HAD family hydrolase [Planctomycetota bacterium]|nr:HAD family hydrolase [Planctomycetota bacterium]